METLAERRAYFADDGTDGILGKTLTSAVLADGEFEVILERTVRGLFDRAYLDVLNASEWNPVFLVVDEDSVYIDHGQLVMLKGHVYEVKEVEPDGTGFTQLMLYWLGRYVIDKAWGYGQSYGTLRYAESDVQFDADNLPLAYPFTVGGTYDNKARLNTLSGLSANP